MLFICFNPKIWIFRYVARHIILLKHNIRRLYILIFKSSNHSILPKKFVFIGIYLLETLNSFPTPFCVMQPNHNIYTAKILVSWILFEFKTSSFLNHILLPPSHPKKVKFLIFQKLNHAPYAFYTMERLLFPCIRLQTFLF